MNNTRILLAVGNENVSGILRKYINKAELLHLIDQEIMHFRYLDEIIELHEPEILIVHDVFLPSDTTGKSEREKEWLSFLHFTRQKYEDLRIVFLCERPRDDIFLNQIVGLGVLDIFNESAIDMVQFVEQLSAPPRYANVAKFRDDSFATVKIEMQEQKEAEEKEDEVANQVQDKNVDSNTEQEDDSEIEQPVNKDEAAPTENKKRTEKKPLEKREREKVKERVIEKLVPLPIEKKIVLVGAPFQRNGSTFISHLLAKDIANLSIPVTYIENPFSRVYTYDRFDGNRKLENYRSVFYSHLKKDIPPNITFDWMEDGVSIIAKHPEEDDYNEEQVNFELLIKILLKIPSPITIIDVGNDWNRKVVRDLFEIASNVFMIIEPDVSDAHYLEDPDNEKTAYYRYIVEQDKTDIIGNRMEESLLKNKLINELYGDKIITTIPTISSKAVFDCQDKAIFINDYDSKVYSKKLLHPVVEKIVPDSMLKRGKRKSKLFSSLLHI